MVREGLMRMDISAGAYLEDLAFWGLHIWRLLRLLLHAPQSFFPDRV